MKNQPDWDRLFQEQQHILEDADIFAIYFGRILRRMDMKTVLDWGCGAGRHASLLAGQGFAVTAMDPSPTGVDAARQRFVNEGLTVKTEVAQPGRIPEGDNQYDAVISMFAIEHGTRSDVSRSVDEIHRIIRPGGVSLIAMTSGEDSMKHYGRLISPSTYAPVRGPETGISHYLTTREDIDRFFKRVEILELNHICSRLSILEGKDRTDAHWVVLSRKP